MNDEVWFLLLQFASMFVSCLAGYGVMSWYLDRRDRKERGR